VYVVVSNVCTGRVRQRFASRRKALTWADRYVPVGKGRHGWRVEVQWGSVR
jgi:hypothetical protein